MGTSLKEDLFLKLYCVKNLSQKSCTYLNIEYLVVLSTLVMKYIILPAIKVRWWDIHLMHIMIWLN